MVTEIRAYPDARRRRGRGVYLAFILIVGIFSGCGQSDDPPQTVRLTLAVVSGMSERPIYERAVQQFMQKNPGIEVEIMEVPGSYYHKVLVMIAGRNAPDLMWMGQGFGEFARRGVFLDVADEIKRDIDLSQFNAQALSWYQLGGRQYAVPYGVDLKFIAYNKTLFDQAGVAYPNNDWTFEQFLDAAKKLTRDFNGDGIIDQFGFRGDLDASLFGAVFVSNDGQRAQCNTPEMIQYLQTNYDLAEKYHVAPSGKQVRPETLDDLVSLFQQRAAAMMQVATWNLPYLLERCRDMDWDILPNPSIGGRRTHWASSQAFVISASTLHPREAWMLSRELVSDEFLRSMSSRIVPTHLRIAEELLDHEGKPQNMEALLIASRTMVPLPRVANLTELFGFWNDACQSVWTGRASPVDAMRRAERDINRTIEMHRKIYE